jgi:DNA polymerase-1
MDQAGSQLEPLFAAILEWKKATKLRSTYFDEFVLDPRGRLHTQFLQHVTPTGRLSSRGPNLQNVPEGKAREIFIAAPGYTLVERDYDQLELKIFAYLADDDLLINSFEWDRHP